MGLANKEKQTVSADIRALIFPSFLVPFLGRTVADGVLLPGDLVRGLPAAAFFFTGIFWAVLHPAAIRANLYSIEVAPVPSVEVQACVLLPEIQPWKLHTFLFIFVSSIVNNYLILL